MGDVGGGGWRTKGVSIGVRDDELRVLVNQPEYKAVELVPVVITGGIRGRGISQEVNIDRLGVKKGKKKITKKNKQNSSNKMQKNEKLKNKNKKRGAESVCLWPLMEACRTRKKRNRRENRPSNRLTSWLALSLSQDALISPVTTKHLGNASRWLITSSWRSLQAMQVSNVFGKLFLKIMRRAGSWIFAASRSTSVSTIRLRKRRP